jgi:hypothetical protein
LMAEMRLSAPGSAALRARRADFAAWTELSTPEYSPSGRRPGDDSLGRGCGYGTAAPGCSSNGVGGCDRGDAGRSGCYHRDLLVALVAVDHDLVLSNQADGWSFVSVGRPHRRRDAVRTGSVAL